MNKQKKFNKGMFVDTEFTKANEKARFINSLIDFFETGFKRERFTKNMYSKLSNMFGHIAHYDINGFYQTWFSSYAARYEFFVNILQSERYGGSLLDVEKEVKKYVVENELDKKALKDLNDSIERSERNTLKLLKRKYEGVNENA